MIFSQKTNASPSKHGDGKEVKKTARIKNTNIFAQHASTDYWNASHMFEWKQFYCGENALTFLTIKVLF